VIGVFPGGTEKNLNLNSLLKPFVDEMLELHPKNGGIPMATANAPLGHSVSAVCMMAVCDLPAAKKVAGFVCHNGDRGCSRCDKQWSSTSAPVNGVARVDGEGETDDESEHSDEEDVKEEKEEKKQKKSKARRTPAKEPIHPDDVEVVQLDDWSELADADVHEVEEKKKRKQRANPGRRRRVGQRQRSQNHSRIAGVDLVLVQHPSCELGGVCTQNLQRWDNQGTWSVIASVHVHGRTPRPRLSKRRSPRIPG
jgi:hypothetical protein